MLLVRVHRTPRLKLFIPDEVSEDPPPIPVDDIDVCRVTKTNSEMQNEKRIDDVWFGPDKDRSLSGLWTGETIFDPIPPPCEPGYMWCSGRKTRIQQTQRPPNVRREVWEVMSSKKRRIAKELWVVKAAELEEARNVRKAEKGQGTGAGQPAQSLRTVGTEPLVQTNVRVMPVTAFQESDEHNEKYVQPSGFACVAEPVPLGIALSIPEANAATQKEWDLQSARRVWDMKSVREKRVVTDDARAAGTTVHFGQISPLCFRKHSEIKSMTKYKGRVVFRGDSVKYQDNSWAVFQEMTSSACLMSASKLIDAVGMLAGHACEQSDAPGAFTQAVLEQKMLTWVTIPRNMWPPSWAKYKNPVAQLIMALYGHPLSGVFWEQKVTRALRAVGFLPINDWECCHYHSDLKLVIAVYVDDFKMVGPIDSLKKGWARIRERLTLDDPTQSGTYLGCDHVQQQYRSDDPQWKAIFTALQEHVLPEKARGNPREADGKLLNGLEYWMRGFIDQCVERYCELCHKRTQDIKERDTPSLSDDDLTHSDLIEKGVLGTSAATILNKILWVARVCRFDILHAVCHLARCVTQWTVACDRRLHRLVGYMKGTRNWDWMSRLLFD